MKFALIDGLKVEARPKLRAICPYCSADMVAKCGKVVIWHWSHRNKLDCDPWWENETEWHRKWKDQFPKDWQEVIHIDPITGEKHIADVKTPHGLVIEFQNSPMSLIEMDSREKFYGNMIWIVNGWHDAGDFHIGLEGEIQSDPIAYRIKWWSKSRLLHNWTNANSKVFLDLGDDVIWQLIFFDGTQNVGAVGPLFRASVIEDCLQGTTPFRLIFRSSSSSEDSQDVAPGKHVP